MKKQNKNFILIGTLILIVLSALYFNGSLGFLGIALPGVDMEFLGYQSISFNSPNITYSSGYTDPGSNYPTGYYLSGNTYLFHKYTSGGSTATYNSIAPQFSPYDYTNYVCVVTGTANWLCTDSYVKADRCQSYNKQFIWIGSVTLDEQQATGTTARPFVCNINASDVSAFKNTLPTTFTRPSDGATRNTNYFGFDQGSVQVVFYPKPVVIEQPMTYYRFSNNNCTSTLILPSQKTTDDYSTLAECQTHINNTCTSNCNPPSDVNNNLIYYIIGGIVVSVGGIITYLRRKR